jgi:aspartate-semialdehyde dehydrogenase
MTRIKVGILGCTGIVGQQFVRMLEGHPYFEAALLAASARSAHRSFAESKVWSLGGEVPESVRDLPIIETGLSGLIESGVHIFFSALPTSMADPIENALRERGHLVFSNASAHRMDHDVPVLVPEVNAAHLGLAAGQAARWGGAIIAGPNCSTSGLVLALCPLLPFGIRSVSVTTFQAISGAGRRGLAAMEIAGNVIPFIRNEESKIAMETCKILGTLVGETIVPLPIEVRASCCRVPVREGHLLGIDVEFGESPEPESVLSAIRDFGKAPRNLELPSAPQPPLLLRTEEDRPQPVLDAFAGTPERARGMAVTVGRPRFKGRSLRLFALVHNTVRGAAGGCLLNAELTLAARLIPERGNLEEKRT